MSFVGKLGDCAKVIIVADDRMTLGVFSIKCASRWEVRWEAGRTKNLSGQLSQLVKINALFCSYLA